MGTTSKPRTTKARKSCGSLSYISYPDLLNSKGDVKAWYTGCEKRSTPKTRKAEIVILRRMTTRLGSLVFNILKKPLLSKTTSRYKVINKYKIINTENTTLMILKMKISVLTDSIFLHLVKSTSRAKS
jgi:hypothetical protein